MKKILSFIFLLLYIAQLKAQTAPHTLSLGFTNGVSSMSYKPNFGKNTTQWGFQVDLSYSYMFDAFKNTNHRFGLSFGASFLYAKNKYILPNYTQSYNAIDIEGETYLHKLVLEKYREVQNINYINFPILFRWEFMPWYVEVGPVIGFNVISTSSIDVDLIKTSGLYPDAIEEFENVPPLGFLTSKNYMADAKLKLGLNLAAAFEVGYLFDMKTGQFGVALYCQYGFMNLHNNKKYTHFIQTADINNQIEHLVSPVIGSLNPASDTPIVGKMNPFIFGIKVQYRIKIQNLETRFFPR
ncbi:MAG: hypothetical protein RR190_00830 [Bacteroidales bacterium]